MRKMKSWALEKEGQTHTRQKESNALEAETMSLLECYAIVMTTNCKGSALLTKSQRR